MRFCLRLLHQTIFPSQRAGGVRREPEKVYLESFDTRVFRYLKYLSVYRQAGKK